VPPEGGAIYDLALTHRSFAFEHMSELRPREDREGGSERRDPREDRGGGAGDSHNERLEFLGDAILGAVVTDLIYRNYPDLAEGEMARLRASVVNTTALAEVARDLELGDHILLGKGEDGLGGRDKSRLLANTLEAVIGAVYLDRGLSALTASIGPLFEARLSAVVETGTRFDSKTALQERVVREHGGLPSYRVAADGPDHDRRFTAHVYVDAELYGAGTGRSKKEAEQQAAREALERLEGGLGARAS
jgi:ribonuclease-3